MEYTKNFEFEIQSKDDFYDIEVINRNFRKLDELLERLQNGSNTIRVEETE